MKTRTRSINKPAYWHSTGHDDQESETAHAASPPERPDEALPDIDYGPVFDPSTSFRSDIVIISKGDMIIYVENANGPRQYLVSSTVISKTSPIWQYWIETANIDNKSSLCPRIFIDNTDPQAFHIVALLAHDVNNGLPKIVSSEVLYELAIFCSRFKTKSLVSLWVSGWIEQLYPEAIEAGSLRWLYIAYVFEYQALFESHLHHTICTTRKQAKSDCLLLEAELPPDVLGTISSAQNEILRRIFSTCSQYFEEQHFKQRAKCYQGTDEETKHACSVYLFGCFLAAMRRNGFWPVLQDPSECCLSPVEVREKLLAFEIDAYPLGGDHKPCSELYQFKADILVQSYTCRMEEYEEHFKTPMLPPESAEGSVRNMVGSHLWNIPHWPKHTFDDIYRFDQPSTPPELSASLTPEPCGEEDEEDPWTETETDDSSD
ncbi:hypothetical protein K491DRAFT_712851 [Lophiostoma macrostomum CBS 122681]|uniref:BTB domain-containing protein n=1 Tax=Lophiostoma macrostomum CBS 122681 TaxID=1314788 RepID=A0A6A6THX4_9PLEO|nr:hypothetical protein K491DRAFT_712851 [Lophiostoma macrostomum CBS 122681]